jgi:hypothetical protein
MFGVNPTSLFKLENYFGSWSELEGLICGLNFFCFETVDGRLIKQCQIPPWGKFY